jgi:tRNA A-37 threonylcarbamoyl transferase component Bud32
VKFSGDNEIVCKKYNQGTKFLKGYKREKRALTKLDKIAQMGFVPRLLKSDEEKRELYMTNCGAPITTATIPDQCYEKVEKLGEMLNSAKIVHGDLVPHNFLHNSDGNICVIDFGRARSMSGKLHENPIGIMTKYTARTSAVDAESKDQTLRFAELAETLCNSQKLQSYFRRTMQKRR